MPARMVNEFVYCPRLFYYEWVDGVFRDSVDTVEGKIQHNRVDKRATEMPAPEAAATEQIHSRSVTLSSERLRVIAKMDLVEGSEGVVTPVDYKHGRPREGPDGLELWPADRAQLAIRAWYCAKPAIGARKASRTTPRRNSACEWRSTPLSSRKPSVPFAPLGLWPRREAYRRRSRIRRNVPAVRWSAFAFPMKPTG
jgi:hypothetical protein